MRNLYLAFSDYLTVSFVFEEVVSSLRLTSQLECVTNPYPWKVNVFDFETAWFD